MLIYVLVQMPFLLETLKVVIILHSDYPKQPPLMLLHVDQDSSQSVTLKTDLRVRIIIIYKASLFSESYVNNIVNRTRINRILREVGYFVRIT